MSSPERVWRIRDATDRLAEDFETAFDYSHGPRDRDRSRTDYGSGGRTAKSSSTDRKSRVSDPTGEIAVTQGAARARVKRAGKHIERASKAMAIAQGILDDVFVTPEEEYEPLRAVSRADTSHVEGQALKAKRGLMRERERLARRLSDVGKELRG